MAEQTLYTNPHDGMLYSATTADGEQLTYFGRRDDQGNVLLITDLDYVTADGGALPDRL